MAAGQPTKYKEVFNEQVLKLCALGAKDTEVADFFKVCEATINNWKKDYPEFLDSIKKGKDDWDSAKVENSLLKRANGYKFIETTKKLFPIQEKNEVGEMVTTGHELKIIKTVKKDVAPDTGAIVVWLTNRNPERWKNKQNIEHSGPNGGPIETKIDAT